MWISVSDHWFRNSIGNIIILLHAASPSPPTDITWELIGSNVTNMAMFMWSPVLSNCSKVKYNIDHSNCGSCPNTTTHTNITCTHITSSTLLGCMLTVQTVVCGNISGDWSNKISLSEKGKTYFQSDLHSILCKLCLNLYRHFIKHSSHSNF